MTWNDISFNQYLDLIHYYENSDQYGDDLDKIVSLLVIFDKETDIEEMYSKKYLEVQELFAPISNVLSQNMVYDTLPYEDFSTLTYGNWIDLEDALKEKDWYNIFSLIFKNKEYDLDLDVLSPVKIFDAYIKIVEYRKRIYENYSFAFSMEPPVETDEETPEERLEREKIQEDQEKNSQFTWYLHTYDLKKGDLTKF